MRGKRGLVALACVLFVAAILTAPTIAVAEAAGTNGWYWPVGRESPHPQMFGFREAGYPTHIGADFPAAVGTPVYAVADGNVAYQGYDGSYAGSTLPGGVVGISHVTSTGRMFYALYGHLYNVTVSTGSHVSAGQVIGYVNDWANGYHVHFGIHPDSVPPMAYIMRGIAPVGSDYGYVDPVAFLNNNHAPGGNPLSPYAGTSRAVTPWTASYSPDCGNALDVGQGSNGPIKFTMVPGHFVGGIVVSKTFDTPVDTFSFHYNQNWHNAWMSFSVVVTDPTGNRRTVKTIDQYGPYSEDVSLSGLNAKKIEVIIWTKQVGDLGAGDVANWCAELSNVNFSSGGWSFAYSNDCGSALDAVATPASPIYFGIRPGHFVGGIVVSKTFDTPVDTFSFHYNQNWHNAWMSFSVVVTDPTGNRRTVKTIDQYGPYSEDVSLSGLNAKKIEVIIWTKKVGDLGAGDVANWQAVLTNVSMTVKLPDATPPNTTSDRVPYYASSATIHLSAVDNTGGSGVAHTFYSLNGFAPVEGSTVDVAGANTYSLVYWSVDAAGNVEVPHTAKFTVIAKPSSGGTPSTPASIVTLRHGRSFTLYGYVIRHAAGTYPVTLQFYRYQSGHWVLRKSITARASNMLTFSKYSRSTYVPYSGKWRVRARHKVGAKYLYSGYRIFTAG